MALASCHVSYLFVMTKWILAWALLLTLTANADNWPSFRGQSASGLAPAGQDLPVEWDVATGEGVRFKVPVPGLAHSSPIVWGDHLYLTTAVNKKEEAVFKPGLYGTGQAAIDWALPA